MDTWETFMLIFVIVGLVVGILAWTGAFVALGSRSKREKNVADATRVVSSTSSIEPKEPKPILRPGSVHRAPKKWYQKPDGSIVPLDGPIP